MYVYNDAYSSYCTDVLHMLLRELYK